MNTSSAFHRAWASENACCLAFWSAAEKEEGEGGGLGGTSIVEVGDGSGGLLVRRGGASARGGKGRVCLLRQAGALQGVWFW